MLDWLNVYTEIYIKNLKNNIPAIISCFVNSVAFIDYFYNNIFNNETNNLIIEQIKTNKNETKIKENLDKYLINDYLMSNTEINQLIYKFYEKKWNRIPFTFEEFEKKVNIGANNIDYMRKQLEATIIEKVWVRNNFRNYNMIYATELNNFYSNNLRYFHCDYTFNNMLYREYRFEFNNNGKINIRKIFNKNFSIYSTRGDLRIFFMWNCNNSPLNNF